MFNPSYRVIFRRFISWCLRKEYRCTSYEAWFLGSRRLSTNSQRSSSMNHPIAGYRNSYSSVHRPSCGSVMPSKPQFPEIVPKESDEANDEVIMYRYRKGVGSCRTPYIWWFFSRLHFWHVYDFFSTYDTFTLYSTSNEALSPFFAGITTIKCT